MTTTEETLSFEKAFESLEKILEKMNSGKTPLEESLKLFEQAESLICTCNRRLNAAEEKIEQLIKNKNELQLDARERPQTQPFGA